MNEYWIQFVGDFFTATLEHRALCVPVTIGAVFILSDEEAEDWSKIAELPAVYGKWRVSGMQIKARQVYLIVTPIAEVTG